MDENPFKLKRDELTWVEEKEMKGTGQTDDKENEKKKTRWSKLKEILI